MATPETPASEIFESLAEQRNIWISPFAGPAVKSIAMHAIDGLLDQLLELEPIMQAEQ